MESPETPEMPQKDGRGRQPKMIPITVMLPVSDHGILMNLTLKRMKQMGEDVPRDRVISEAIQCLAKTQNSEAGA